jgi:hypothetical protein
MLDDKIVVYTGALILIQLIVVSILFEFIRKPWNGAELMIEKAEAVQN